jgi:hypothetical protein
MTVSWDDVLTAAFVTGLGALGTVSLVWPEKIQEHARRYNATAIGRRDPYSQWTFSRSYRACLRIIGIVTLTMAAMTVWALLSPGGRWHRDTGVDIGVPRR